MASFSLRISLASGGKVVKRSMDVLFSALLLVAALPVLLIAALAIRIDSPGPVLFRQWRTGRRFQNFQILKLRTMAHAEAGLQYTLGPDPRITVVGKWLRRTKVDEIPQLWNILRGEMSLVGPRPVLPELTREFGIHYKLLLRVRPGLTDPASLKYCQEARLLATAHDPLGFFKTVVTPDKIQISLDYLDNSNVWSDCLTLIMTVFVCAFPGLSRVYGRLPVPRGSSAYSYRKKESKSHIPLPVRPISLRERTDSCAFNQEVLRAISKVEKPSLHSLIPWNLLSAVDVSGQSTSSDSKSGGMRL